MNRQEALKWLVENVTKWPDAMTTSYRANYPEGWITADDTNSGDTIFMATSVLFHDDELTADKIITKADWLVAVDNVRKKEGGSFKTADK